MIPERDPLELELESFPPPQLPSALRARIARAIDAERQADRAGVHARWPVRWLLAGALAAAACVIASLVWLHGPRRNVATTGPTVTPSHRNVKVQSPGHQFATLAAYTRAAAESPDRLDSLLNADAAKSLMPGTSHEMRGFDSSLDDLKP